MTINAKVLDPTLLLIGAGALWSVVAVYAGPEAMASPLATARIVFQYFGDASFWGDTAATGRAFVYATLLTIVIGLSLGVFLGVSRFARQVCEPALSAIYSTPKITLYPIILLLFGLDIWAKVAFGVLHGIFPVAFFTIGAIKNLPAKYLKTGRIMRLSRSQTILTIVLPAVLPEITTGLRIGICAALNGTIVGELFASDRGLGFLLVRSMATNRVAETMALTFVLFAFAIAINKVLLSVEHRVHRSA